MSQSITLLSRERLLELFPKTKVKGRDEVKALIVHGSSDEEICKKIRAVKRDLLEGRSTEYALSTLDVAILLGKSVVALALLGVKVEFTSCDGFGWKPIHKAALVCQELYLEFIRRGQDPKERTTLGATCQDLRRLCGLEPAIYRQINYQGSPMSPEEFCKGTSMERVSDENYFQGALAFKLWSSRSCTVEDPRLQHGLKDSYLDYLKRPVALSVNVDPIISHGLVASETIPLGTCLGEYTGEVLESESTIINFYDAVRKGKSDLPYLFNDVDAKRVGSLMRFVNDGFPNCLAFHLENLGVPVRILFVAPENLEPGPLLWDYRPGEVGLKWGTYAIQGRERMHDFYRHRTPTEVSRELCKIAEEVSRGDEPYYLGNCRFQGMNVKLLYPLTTPMALIDLTCTRIVEPKEWLPLLMGDSAHLWKSFPPVFAPTQELIQLLQRFYDRQSTLPDSLVLEIQQFIRGLEGRYTVPQIVYAIHFILTTDNLNVKWPIVKRVLEAKLPSYIWYQDRKFPLQTLLPKHER